MTCSQCGATIAAKALICYKCGAQTTAPKHQAAAVQASRGWVVPALVAAVVLVAAVLAWRAGFFVR